MKSDSLYLLLKCRWHFSKLSQCSNEATNVGGLLFIDNPVFSYRRNRHFMLARIEFFVMCIWSICRHRMKDCRLLRRILHISWHDFVSNDEVLQRTGLFDVSYAPWFCSFRLWRFINHLVTYLLTYSYIVRKRRLGLFGHVARLHSDVPANSILRICTKTSDGERPSQEWRRTCGRPSTTSVHQICRDMGVTATEALLLSGGQTILANDRNGGRLRLIASRHNDDDDDSVHVTHFDNRILSIHCSGCILLSI